MFDPGSKEIWKMALTDQDVEIRKTALKYSSVVPENLISEYETLLSDSSYLIIESVLNLLCAQFKSTESVNKYLDMTKGIDGNNEKNILLSWLQIDYYENEKRKV